jgi:RNA polymerase sigma-70 factor, ECF subfamily
MLAMADQGVSRVVALGCDPDSFRAFYEEALPRVYGYLLRRCGSVVVAEDLTQETFLAAVVELRKTRRVEQPLGWVLGIARHKLIDHFRSTQKRGARETSAVVDHAVLPDEGRDERAISALSAVPRDQRIALVLRHVDGLSVPEVALLLGRSVEAAESLLARGRVAFREAYGEAVR